jgi:hypothetical protein
MVQYIPMIILMAVFGAIGLYWAIGTGHFITWTRRFKTTFPKYSDDNSSINGQDSAVGTKTTSSAALKWGIRLVGIALACTAVATIVKMIVQG